MTDRIKCANCKAQSFNDTKTILYCTSCYNTLQAEAVRLEQQVKMLRTQFQWTHRAKEQLRTELAKCQESE